MHAFANLSNRLCDPVLLRDMQQLRCSPYFTIIGAQKGGTTSLFHYSYGAVKGRSFCEDAIANDTMGTGGAAANCDSEMKRSLQTAGLNSEAPEIPEPLLAIPSRLDSPREPAPAAPRHGEPAPAAHASCGSPDTATCEYTTMAA